ncbi:sex-determining region Y protein-like [Topomyia yanbarensis]|uniref:sex-determining region Y protein-like n=1 Tax=Topomyia yanbarensis TaxID=2498891 RepID=UPI00273C8B90|nr:sex-determining region Y protein-like [Topomyia yanbarensis]
MNWKVLLIFGCTLITVSASERPLASSYVFRSFDSSPGQIVYLSPARSRLVYPSLKKRESIEVKTNLEQADESSKETGRVEDSDEDEPKVLLHLKDLKHSSESDESFEERHHSKKGDQDRKGFNSHHQIKKGSKGSYGNENHSTSYADEGDRKKSYHDEDSYHKDHHDEAHRTRGGSHSEKKHHKKGSKTTGYHNVYHKDEFKKEQIFYDTADHSGHFKKYGSSHKEHSNDAGEFAKGGHKEESHSEKKKSRKGHSEDGKYDDNHHEFKKHRKDEKEYHDREEFHKRDGNTGANEHGYKIYHQ